MLFLHDEKITTMCIKEKDLITDIEKSKRKKPSSKDYENYIKEFLGFFDGKSSERATNEIIKLIN